ncbi:MAG TPA: pyridoxal phosphate-dependent aminotransferase [Polyangia bacterium]|nr:pyridoxal phosphate-dependent aminotransferase [Polyangia bacterium]
MTQLSTRLDEIKPSPTLAVTQKAQELRARGIDVISFSAGEPDFDTPPHIREAAKAALDRGATRYTAVAGIPELREAVAKESATVRGVPCEPAQVVITVGAKHALFGFFLAVLDPGDEVIVPAPYWVSYPDQVRFAGGKPVIVETRVEDGWVLTPDNLSRAATPRTRALVLNTPSNPTGGIYGREALAALTSRALELGLWVVADEIYRELVYDGFEHFSPLSVVDGAGRSRIFVVDGVSKSFAMTGWRIGWGIGDPDLIKGIAKIQGQSTSNATTMAQHAALAAVTGPRDFLDGWRSEYARRRDVIVAGLERMPGVSCPKPLGAFYALPDVSALVAKLGAGATDVELANHLLEEARVATVPGTAFGAPGHIRLSYATSMNAIEQGLSRMEAAFAKL